MIPYILIIVTTAYGGYATLGYPVVTFQRFDDVKACQLASLEIAKRVDLVMVCVPERSK